MNSKIRNHVNDKNYILTIAGLDPSSGAGITSDLKTFEAHNFYGLSVCTAVTVQNDVSFKKCIWIERDDILSQLETLLERFTITAVKIGVVKSWDVLLEVLTVLRAYNSSILIVLDPILKASAGFTFHDSQNLHVLEKVLEKCDFITPNYEEIQELFPDKSIEDTINFITQRTNIYLKGGHRMDKKGWDEVYYDIEEKLVLPPISTGVVFEKHGSGCVLSSALASYLSQGVSIEEACKNTKRYIEQFLTSNETLLGTHNYENS
ncbi:hydroxymethylpyrimidine/phosphomethylpyrimidine kinase [Nonlabens xylanidelens]|uniref:hydroxymethylpyrimidine/phosphomethylpyrimidine kinase n=1 Tax=Nonlabens xylanidelens TaxID=191564 RepID=UPI002011409F|nr:hydroxymethylpyrimidine/phosphomethylpyrimidine kinase [Nonlabens xylanidelens]